MKKKSSFTLLEVLITLIILAILAAIAIPVYDYAVQKQEMDTAAAEMTAILEAIKIYDMKYDSLPSSLAKAWRKCGEKALAAVNMRKSKDSGGVFFDSLYAEKTGFDTRIDVSGGGGGETSIDANTCFSARMKAIKIKCTSHTHKDPFYYGINSSLVGVRWAQIMTETKWVNTAIVAECDNEGKSFSGGENGRAGIARDTHKRGFLTTNLVGMFIKRDKTVFTITGGGVENRW